MPKERLQILIEPEQRRALEQASERTGLAIGMLVRQALDEYFRPQAVAAREMLRRGAVERIAGRSAPVPEPDELRRLIDER
jgi:hypothetical protein